VSISRVTHDGGTRKNMEIPKVYLDTTILKASTTALRRLLPRKQTLYWGGNVHEVTVYDIGTVNPNASLTGEIKTEVELLGSKGLLDILSTLKLSLKAGAFRRGWAIQQGDFTVLQSEVLPLQSSIAE
jgi:hypothetical protein